MIAKRFISGDKVAANGELGVIESEYIPPRIEGKRLIQGMYNVRLPGGVACISAQRIHLRDRR